MSERPTADEVIEAWWLDVDLADTPTDALKRHGYVIVHPDDHLRRIGTPRTDIHSLDSYNQGRDALWRDIFGDPS